MIWESTEATNSERWNAWKEVINNTLDWWNCLGRRKGKGTYDVLPKHSIQRKKPNQWRVDGNAMYYQMDDHTCGSLAINRLAASLSKISNSHGRDDVLKGMVNCPEDWESVTHGMAKTGVDENNKRAVLLVKKLLQEYKEETLWGGWTEDDKVGFEGEEKKGRDAGTRTRGEESEQLLSHTFFLKFVQKGDNGKEVARGVQEVEVEEAKGGLPAKASNRGPIAAVATPSKASNNQGASNDKGPTTEGEVRNVTSPGDADDLLDTPESQLPKIRGKVKLQKDAKQKEGRFVPMSSDQPFPDDWTDEWTFEECEEEEYGVSRFTLKRFGVKKVHVDNLNRVMEKYPSLKEVIIHNMNEIKVRLADDTKQMAEEVAEEIRGVPLSEGTMMEKKEFCKWFQENITCAQEAIPDDCEYVRMAEHTEWKSSLAQQERSAKLYEKKMGGEGKQNEVVKCGAHGNGSGGNCLPMSK
jgi:hypothetical protein